MPYLARACLLVFLRNDCIGIQDDTTLYLDHPSWSIITIVYDQTWTFGVFRCFFQSLLFLQSTQSLLFVHLSERSKISTSMSTTSRELQRWTSPIFNTYQFILDISFSILKAILAAPNSFPPDQLLLTSLHYVSTLLYNILGSFHLALLTSHYTIPPEHELQQGFNSVCFYLLRSHRLLAAVLRSRHRYPSAPRALSQRSLHSFIGLWLVTFRESRSLLPLQGTIPPEKLLIQILWSSRRILKMASISVQNLRAPPKKPKGLLDLPIDIKKKILTYNGDEQIVMEIGNPAGYRSFVSIGHDPMHMDQPAPKSVWNLARVCFQLMNEFFPLIPRRARRHNKDDRQIKQRLLRYSAVSFRRYCDIADACKIYHTDGILHLLSVMRLWEICSQDALKFFLMDPKRKKMMSFVEGVHECWPSLVRLDVVPMVYPPYDDTRWDPNIQQEYDVPRYTWLLEQVVEADVLPCLAERKAGGVLWRSFCWRASQFRRPDPILLPVTDQQNEWTAEDYANEPEW